MCETRTCKTCGGTSFYETSKKCKYCVSVTQAKYRANNVEKLREKERIWKENNKDKVNAHREKWEINNKNKRKESVNLWHSMNKARRSLYMQKWACNNKLKTKEYHKKYRFENKELVRSHSANRRVRENTAFGKLSKGLFRKLFVLQRGLCPCCGEKLGRKAHMDHIQPLSKGGTNSDDNIQLLRARCNQEKSAKDPIDFMRGRGFLL